MRWGHGWLVLAACVFVSAGARAAAPADAAGRYTILREGGKDTGCMLTLDNQERGLSAHLPDVLPAFDRDLPTI